MEFSHERYDSVLEKERLKAADLEKQAQETDNADLRKAAEETRENAEAVLLGMRKEGLSPSQVRVISKDSESNGDGTKNTAAYDPESDDIAFASIETLHETKGELKLEDHVSQAGDHELRHQQIEQNAARKGHQGLIVAQFGEERYKGLHELAASKGTTEGHDAYDRLRAETRSFIRANGLSEPDLIRDMLQGDHDKIVSKAA